MLTWQLILIQVITFILIVLTLRWLLYSHISQALKKLHKLNKQNLAKEKALKEELARAEKQAQGEIDRAKSEAGEVRKKIKKEAEAEAEKLLDQARKGAKRIVETGTRESQRKVSQMTALMEENSAYLALDIIRHIFSQNFQKNLQSQLVDELIGEIENIPEEKLKVEDSRVEVISAFSLDSRQDEQLKSILSSKLKRPVSLKKQIDKAIVAGIILRSGGFVLDGSVRNKLKKILPFIKEKAKEDKIDAHR